MTTDTNNRAHVEAGVTGGGQFATEKRKEPLGVLATRRSTGTPGAAEFAAVAEEAYNSVVGDTYDELKDVREKLASVIYGEYEGEFGFSSNQESQHPAVVEYQRVTLATLSNYVTYAYPDAAQIRLTQSDDDLDVFGEAALLDSNGDVVQEDILEDHLGDDVEVFDLVNSFGMTTLQSIQPDAIAATEDRYNGKRAFIDLTKAPRTLR
jgi:hypothetical protein